MESLVSRNSSAILCQSLIQLLPWNDSRFTPACQTRICHLICEILLWVSAKEPHKKPEELRESLYNNSITKGSPRIPSKNILLCPSIHMWKKKKKKCLRSNCSSHNISLQKCWNYLSTWNRSLCSCCHTLLWSAGNLCAVLPPAAPKPGEKEADRDMLWWPRPFYLLLAFTGPVYQTIDFLKNKTACQEQKNSYSCKQLLPVCGMETASYLVSSSMKLAISWSAFAAQTILFTEHFSLGDHPTEVTK